MAPIFAEVAFLFGLVAMSIQGCSEDHGNDDGSIEPPFCPYNFTEPTCDAAGVQAPRNVSNQSEGEKKALFMPLTQAQLSKLRRTNIHFHYGAEHYSHGEYMHVEESGDAHGITPGFMCNASEHELEAYDFKYCQGVEVGKTYEVHYVWSSAGLKPEKLADGLGLAANGRNLLNPFIVVQAQVFVIVNNAELGNEDLTKGWESRATDAVSYAGSTTGTTFDNNICSPYHVSWHVDRKCHAVNAESFDNMCKTMINDHGMKQDVSPQGSRKLVDAQFVVPWEEVEVIIPQ